MAARSMRRVLCWNRTRHVPGKCNVDQHGRCAPAFATTPYLTPNITWWGTGSEPAVNVNPKVPVDNAFVLKLKM